MTLFLQYNVNNHILDDVRHLWWPSILSVSESVCTEQGSTEFRTPLCVVLATPLCIIKHNRLEPNYANVAVIEMNKILYELWHNCSSYGHSIEYNGLLY